MKNKVKEMEDEAEKLIKLQEQVEESLAEEGGGEEDAAAEADSRSVYVGQVDYSATPEELQEHFAACGTVNRVTILCDQFRNPKGYAYIEFDSPEAVEAAVALNESEFKGRQIKVRAPRTLARRCADHAYSRARLDDAFAGDGEAHQRARLRRAWARTRTRRLREGQGRKGQGQGRLQGQGRV